MPLEFLDRAIDLVAAGKTVGLQEDLLRARREALQTQNTLEELGRENRALREKLTLSGEFFRREGALWLDGGRDAGPYCTACWDRKRDAIRLNVNIAGAFCPACEEAYDISAETRGRHGFPTVGRQPVKMFGISVLPDQP